METVSSTSSLMASTSLKITTAKARLKRSQQVNNLARFWEIFLQKIFRVQTHSEENEGHINSIEEAQINSRIVQQLRAITWPEITNLVRTGLSGYWPLAVFLIVGHAAAHITGPSIVLSVFIAAFTSILSGRLS